MLRVLKGKNVGLPSAPQCGCGLLTVSSVEPSWRLHQGCLRQPQGHGETKSEALASFIWGVLPNFQTGGLWTHVFGKACFFVLGAVRTAGSISDVCPDKVEQKKTFFRLKWKMLENVQMGNSMRIVGDFLPLSASQPPMVQLGELPQSERWAGLLLLPPWM